MHKITTCVKIALSSMSNDAENQEFFHMLIIMKILASSCVLSFVFWDLFKLIENTLKL